MVRQRKNGGFLSSSHPLLSTGVNQGQRRNTCFLGEHRRLKAKSLITRDSSGERAGGSS